MKVAGLAPVLVPGIENINVTELVPGHMAYRASMPKLLREVGWMVESDEFTEIEDPDPENHDQRQRELITEIEEARKELEKKPEKKGFSFWRKKKVEKKAWEVYDEQSKAPAQKDGEPTAENPDNPENTVMFDVDAIRAEVANLSANDDGLQVKEIESTLPPMKIETKAIPPPYSTLRETKSYNDSLAPHSGKFGASTGNLSTSSIGGHPSHRSPSPSYRSPSPNRSNGGWEEYNENEDGMTMTFDSSFKDPPSHSLSRSKSPSLSYGSQPLPNLPKWDDTSAERPPLKSSATEPSVNLTPGYNAWADEFDDDWGKEKEMEMTFE